MRFVLTLLLLLAVAPAQAMSLGDARAQGLIGETPQGYVAPVGAQNAEVQALVNEVNAGRRAEYQSIANRTGSTLQQVEAVTGQRLYKQVPAGTFLLIEGQWRKK
ncbi:MAG: YdbL family protein [Alphaproteobacteria bacterium]|nr:YdbL family protein [Alphaproteobacteria bacterium]MCB9928578.1 YdbL family protein [Alphaproteobacteria bacterium]